MHGQAALESRSPNVAVPSYVVNWELSNASVAKNIRILTRRQRASRDL